MTRRKTITLGGILTIALLAGISTIFIIRHRKPVTLRGAVLRDNPDANRQLPLADVEVTAINALGRATAKSDASGSFTLPYPRACAAVNRWSLPSGARSINLWM